MARLVKLFPNGIDVADDDCSKQGRQVGVMVKRRRVVVSHLENISGSALEKYHPQIKQLIKGRSGIYALYRNHNLYYVGLATNLMRRLKQHLRDHHEKKWNRFSVYATGNDEHMKELESLLLRIVNPRGNRQSGKIAR